MPLDLISFALSPEQIQASRTKTSDPILSKIGTTGGIPIESTDIHRFANDTNFKMLGYDAFRNNDYVYDDAQTTGQWWGNTIKRALHPLTTSFAESFRYDKTFKELFDPTYSASQDPGLKDYLKKSEELNYLYPNYDNPDVGTGFTSYFSSGARNKWSSLLESGGFMVGTALGGIAQSVILGLLTAPEGGVGAAVGIADTANALSQAARVSRTANAYNKINNVNKLWQQTKAAFKINSNFLQGVEALNDIRSATTQIGAIKGVTKLLGTAAIRFQASSTEGMLEAIEGSDHFFKQQVQEKEQELGRPLSKEEKDEIQDYSADLFSARYKANLGVLMTTNLLQDYNFFNTFQKLSKVGRAGQMLESVSKKSLYSPTLGAFVKASQLPVKELVRYRAGQLGGFAFKNVFSEGLEEGAQYAIDKATNDYYTKKYNKQTVSMMDSIGKGLSAAVGDQEGKENFWSGAIMGGLFSTIGVAATGIHNRVTGTNRKVNALTSDIIDRNNTQQENLIKLMKTELTMSSTSENAILNNENNKILQDTEDPKVVEQLRKQTLRNAVKTAKETGKYDIFIDRLKSYSDMSDEDFKKQFGITDTMTKAKSRDQYISELISEAETIKQDVDILDEKLPNPFQNYENIDPIKKADDRKKVFIQYKAWEESKNVILENLSELRDSHKIIQENKQWFNSKGVIAEDVLSYIADDSSPARQTKIENILTEVASLESVLNEPLLSKKDRTNYVKQLKELDKELTLYTNLEQEPNNVKHKVALFKHLQDKSISIIAPGVKEFGKDLETKLTEAVDTVNRNKNALEAIDALEDPNLFNSLVDNYAQRYNERYERIQDDIKQNEEEDRNPTPQQEEPIQDAVVVEEPTVTEDVIDKALDSDGKDIDKQYVDIIADKKAKEEPLTEEEEKLWEVANPSVRNVINEKTDKIRERLKREEQIAKDPEGFPVLEKIKKIKEQWKESLKPIWEKIKETEKQIAKIPTPTTESLQDKIDDIEKRRKEELNSIEFVEKGTFEGREVTINKWKYLKDGFNTRGGGETREELVDEINTKYNKELEDLKKEEVIERPRTFDERIESINNRLGKLTMFGTYENSPKIIFSFKDRDESFGYLTEPITKEGEEYRIKTLRYNVTIDDGNSIISVTSDKGKTFRYKGEDIGDSTVDIQAEEFSMDELRKILLYKEPTSTINPELEKLKQELALQKVELDKVNTLFSNQIKREENKLKPEEQKPEEETTKDLPKAFAGLTTNDIKALEKRYRDIGKAFWNGQVFRTSTGPELVSGQVNPQNYSERRMLESLVKDNILKRTIDEGKSLEQLGIHLTLKKDNDTYFHEDDAYKLLKGTPRHLVLGVLTDKDGNDLYFTNDGKITKDAKKGIRISEQIFEVDKDIDKRIAERVDQRAKVLSLTNEENISPQEEVRIKEEVTQEFKLLSEIKNYIRQGNQLTLSNVNISPGFEEKELFETIEVKDIPNIKNIEIQIQQAESTEDRKQKSGFAFIQPDPNQLHILNLPLLTDKYGKVIKVIEEDIISPKGNVNKKTIEEVKRRRKFLKAVIYRTGSASADEIEEYNEDGTQLADNTTSTRGIKEIRIDGTEKQFQIIPHTGKNRVEDLGLHVNVDKELLEKNEKFTEYIIDENGKLKPVSHKSYQDFIKSISTITASTNQIQNKERRYNIVFGFSPSEAATKFISTKNTTIEVETPPVGERTETEDEIQMRKTREAFGELEELNKIEEENNVKLVEDLTKAAVFFTPKEEEQLKDLGVSFKEQTVFSNIQSTSNGIVSLRMIKPFIAKPEDNLKTGKTYILTDQILEDGTIVPRSYKVETLIEKLKEGTKEESKINEENPEILPTFEGIPEEEVDYTKIKKTKLYRSIKNINFLKEGTSREDIINTLIKNNIIEKICNT